MLLRELSPVTESREKEIQEHLNNWLTLSQFLKTAGIDDVRDLISLEIWTRQRLDILHRLHSRYISLRRIEEKREIAKVISGEFTKEDYEKTRNRS